MSLLFAKVSLEGVRPLLWHHLSPEALSVKPREKTGRAGNDPSEWQRTVLTTKKGQLYVETTYIFGCLREAAKYSRRKLGTFQSLVSATVQVCDELILINQYLPKAGVQPLDRNQPAPVYLDVRVVRNPGTRAMNIRYRVAAAPGWKASFTIMWDNTVIGREQMESILTDAGKFVGIGSGRSLGFGRFRIVKIDVSGAEDAEAPPTEGSVGKNSRKRVAAR